MLYLCQFDYSDVPYITRTEFEGEMYEYGQKTTVASSGCGLCSAVMMLDRLIPNSKFDPVAARDLSYELGANHRKGTAYKIFAPALAERFGLKLEMTSDIERLKHCLRTNGAAVAHISGNREGYTGVFSKGGHYVAVIGEEPDGRLAVLDPSYKEGKYEEEGRQGKVELKNGVIALCAPETLAEDTTERTPSFYLFWRA